MERDEFDSLNPIQQEMWLIIARFYTYQHGCLPANKRTTATFKQLEDVDCEFVDDVSLGEYQEILDALQQASLYVVQEETLFD